MLQRKQRRVPPLRGAAPLRTEPQPRQSQPLCAHTDQVLLRGVRLLSSLDAHVPLRISASLCVPLDLGSGCRIACLMPLSSPMLRRGPVTGRALLFSSWRHLRQRMPAIFAVALLSEAALFLLYRCSHRLTNAGALAPALPLAPNLTMWAHAILDRLSACAQAA